MEGQVKLNQIECHVWQVLLTLLNSHFDKFQLDYQFLTL